MQFSALVLSVSATLIAAATATDNMNRDVDSGCRALSVLSNCFGDYLKVYRS